MASELDVINTVESFLGVSLRSESVVMILTTTVAVILGLLIFVWRRTSDRGRDVNQLVAPKAITIPAEDDEAEAAVGKTKVTVFFGTQTGTAEGFAKVIFFFFGD